MDEKDAGDERALESYFNRWVSLGCFRLMLRVKSCGHARAAPRTHTRTPLARPCSPTQLLCWHLALNPAPRTPHPHPPQLHRARAQLGRVAKGAGARGRGRVPQGAWLEKQQPRQPLPWPQTLGALWPQKALVRGDPVAFSPCAGWTRDALASSSEVLLCCCTRQGIVCFGDAPGKPAAPARQPPKLRRRRHTTWGAVVWHTPTPSYPSPIHAQPQHIHPNAPHPAQVHDGFVYPQYAAAANGNVSLECASLVHLHTLVRNRVHDTPREHDASWLHPFSSSSSSTAASSEAAAAGAAAAPPFRNSSALANRRSLVGAWGEGVLLQLGGGSAVPGQRQQQGRAHS